MDLNDTIIESYLKILISKMVSSLVERKTHIYSTFFMKKLLPNALRDEK
jgi:Ulp1 family protease